ncbi:protein wos2 [Caerostris extrusa]|uniref:Protein wos2 n=1 Tax=Caerostris extrusa TaxID=172846 RepID=A0AAV4WHP0_CAEEX|nr:protein wos2 [Caerostris extrusa]
MSEPGNDKRLPPLTWAERRNLVYLTINVTDCKKPDIKLSSDKLYFSGKNGEGQDYEVTLQFFKEINVETSKYSVKDRAIDFIIMKAEGGSYWNRLLKDNKKYHWLRIDFAKWKDEDDSDIDLNDGSDLEEMMKQMGGLQSSMKQVINRDLRIPLGVNAHGSEVS